MSPFDTTVLEYREPISIASLDSVTQVPAGFNERANAAITNVVEKNGSGYTAVNAESVKTKYIQNMLPSLVPCF